MLRITDCKYQVRETSVCQKVAKRRLRLHMKRLRRKEYSKLKAIVPSVAATDNVPKVIVIEEAIKYIDELHEALLERIKTATESPDGTGSSDQDADPASFAHLIRHLLPGQLFKPHTTSPLCENKRRVATYLQNTETMPECRKS